MKKATLTLLFVALTAAPALAQARKGGSGYPPEMPGAKVEVYKTIGDVQLKIYIFEPEGHKASDKTATIVFFFGGGWSSGSPGQFLNQCKHLASRGMVAMSADYRVATRQGVKALQCVQDAKSAVRWVRANAQRLGIDPQRIAAGGGSAGGHIAACTGTIEDRDEPGEDTSVSSIPNAMVLFNPAVVLATEGLDIPLDKERSRRVTGLADRMGIKPINLSPCHHVKKGAPPTILFHGTADTTVPFRTAELFAQAMTKAGNVCKLVPFEDRGHGFFNYGRAKNEDYETTVRAMDEFLLERGFLKGKS